MRVLLIYPDTDALSIIPKGLINIEPLGLEYLAAGLHQHDVKVLDMKVERNWQHAVQDFEPDIVGITGTVVHTNRILDVLAYVKQVRPTAATVVGGTHATLAPGDLAAPQVDFLVAGPNPLPFYRLVECLDLKRPVTGIGGLHVRTGQEWMLHSPAPHIGSLDHLPLPRRDLTSVYRSRYCHLVWKPVALVITSIGCTHACNFCPCPVLTGHRVLLRSPRLVRDELLAIEEPYVYIADDNLFFDYRHASELARLIEQAGIRKQYYILSRADDINKHPELIERWAALGLKKVFLGLESPSDREIKALNKRGSVSDNSRAVEILHANRVDPLGAFIILPEYTRADFDRILEYMDRMRIYYFEFTILTPFPGTPYFDEVEDRLLTRDRRMFDLAHSLLPTQLPASEFYQEFSRLYRRAASPLRALRIKPTVSPFRRMAYFRQAPQLLDLFVSARAAYNSVAKVNNV